MRLRFQACALTLAGLGAGMAVLGWRERGAEVPMIAGRPMGLALAAMGAGLVGLAILLAALALGRPDAGEGMLSTMLLRTGRPALFIAWGADAILAIALVGMHFGVEAADARGLGPAAEDWPLYGAASLAVLLLAVLAASALTWSTGRGTPARKAIAVRRHLYALGFVALPWVARAVLMR